MLPGPAVGPSAETPHSSVVTPVSLLSLSGKTKETTQGNPRAIPFVPVPWFCDSPWCLRCLGVLKNSNGTLHVGPVLLFTLQSSASGSFQQTVPSLCHRVYPGKPPACSLQGHDPPKPGSPGSFCPSAQHSASHMAGAPVPGAERLHAGRHRPAHLASPRLLRGL